MLMGISLQAHPNAMQKQVLSQWMGCARTIWNAKVAEEKYYQTFARKYYPIGTYAPIDQKTSQFKSKELTPWLSKCPSQIIRNSAVNWYQTFNKFKKGLNNSMGMGKMVVELLSVAISFIVCKYLSWSAVGCFSMISEASANLLAA